MYLLMSFNHTYYFSLIKTCDIRAEGTKRFLTLKDVQLDQSGEVSYQALNAITTGMLLVKGEWVKNLSAGESCMLTCVLCQISFDR